MAYSGEYWLVNGHRCSAGCPLWCCVLSIYLVGLGSLECPSKNYNNIMIVSLPRSVCIHTIVKEGVSSDAWTHNDTWCPNVFPFIILYNNLSSVFFYIISFYHNFSCVYRGCALCQFNTLFVNHIISYISSGKTYHIINLHHVF